MRKRRKPVSSEKTTVISEKQPSGAWSLFWAVLLVAGVGAWLYCLLAGDGARAWRAVLINFIYFTPLAAGMVVWPAIVKVSNGKWTGRTHWPALSAVGFAPVSLLVLLGLWLGREQWVPWLHATDLPQGWWFNAVFVFVRDGLALALFWMLAWVYFRRGHEGESKTFAGWFIFAYTMIMSLVGFDLVMGLDPHWFSALFGIYFFISGLYAAVVAWTVLVIIEHPETSKDKLHDLGKLVVAFSLLTTYMMFSQLLVIWYENLPAEVRFVIPRLTRPPWKWVSAVILAVVYLGPLVLLLTRWSKRNRAYLGTVVVLVLLGLWGERWWLVTPTLGGEMSIGLSEVGATLAFLAAMVLAVRTAGKWSPGPEAGEAQ